MVPWPSTTTDDPVASDEASTLDEQEEAGERVSHVAPRSIREADGERYERRERLGVGAMGEVHLCHDVVMKRDVAMKTPLARPGGRSRSLERLAREARIQGRLEHPAIVPVHDLGFDAHGEPFFTMKRVQGTSLRAVLTKLRAGDLATRERYGRRRLLTAFSTVCVAVAFAHARGVLHRDIKPSNVMLGDFGEVYLLDWGVAKGEDDGLALSLTRTGDMVGTVGYMAPEQARGERDVDERTDVFALGALLFELLTSEPLQARTVAVALRSTLVGDYDARPSVRAPDAKVPPELEELCVRATAFRREDRVASARELHEAIERYLDGDRDVERRRAFSAEHARQARALAARALHEATGAGKVRQRAIDEASRALALDPSNATAVHVMAAVALLTEPGAEADEALRESSSTSRRLIARASVGMFIPWLLGVGVAALFGVRHGWPLVLAALATAAAGVLAWWRSRTDSVAVTFGTLIACELAAVFTSAVFGPLLVMPGLLAACALAFTIATESRGSGVREPRFFRAIALGTALLAYAAPFLLELVGAVPPSYAFEAGAIRILPRAVDFPPGLAVPCLVLANALLVTVPSLLAIQVRDHAHDVERSALEALSRARQLLPTPVKGRA
jgi:serine/threonine-protein kinase